jgi:hypothetical protein
MTFDILNTGIWKNGTLSEGLLPIGSQLVLLDLPIWVELFNIAIYRHFQQYKVKLSL